MAALTASAQAVLAYLARSGEASRPQLSQALTLSKPTVSAAMAELERLGLVGETGSTQGWTGRSALLYGLGERAGHVLAVDVGVTRVRLRAQTLSGRQLLHRTRRVAPGTGGDVVTASARAAGALLREALPRITGGGPLRHIAVALPTVVADPDPAAAGHRPEVRDALRALAVPDAPLSLENNVNCAAVAEGHLGVAQGASQFAYVQVGVRIGAAHMFGGRLLRGASGSAGEVSRLPFPWAPGSAPTREGLERYLGAEQLLSRTVADWPRSAGERPGSAEELFRRAAEDSAPARRAVDEHAVQVGRLIAAVACLLDPGLVVLGGGVGSNPLLLPGVRDALADMGVPAQTRQSTLGSTATLEGAVVLAHQAGLGRLLEDGE